MKLRELGEDRLLAQLLPRLPRGKSVFAGAGDDCALVEAPGRREFLVEIWRYAVNQLERSDPQDLVLGLRQWGADKKQNHWN